jgi:hypothetical protein
MTWLIPTTVDMWNPLAWVVAFLLAMALVLIIRAIGNKRYARGGMTKPFLSGNINDPEGSAGAGDIYWGFTSVFKPLINALSRMHTGITNDYIGAFVFVLAILLLIIILT